jgi:probable phosphoglycerate mutase
MTTLVVWRHGQTVWNATSRLQGQEDVALDETGREQAAQAAGRVAERWSPGCIISSDLLRAQQTAAPLSDLTGVTVELDPRLRERHFGPWQGLTAAQIQQRYPEDYVRWRADTITHPGIETVTEMAERVGAAFREAARRAEDTVAVLVTHTGSARVGCGVLLGWPQSLWRTVSGLHNCKWAELHYSPDRGGWQLRSHNAG